MILFVLKDGVGDKLTIKEGEDTLVFFADANWVEFGVEDVKLPWDYLNTWLTSKGIKE